MCSQVPKKAAFAGSLRGLFLTHIALKLKGWVQRIPEKSACSSRICSSHPCAFALGHPLAAFAECLHPEGGHGAQPVTLVDHGQGLPCPARLCSLCPECSMTLDTPSHAHCLHSWPPREGRKRTRVVALTPFPSPTPAPERQVEKVAEPCSGCEVG